MRVTTILGARPQFIKASPVSRALRARGHQEVLIHTGQHFEWNMSGVFFEELDLPSPGLNLGVAGGTHGRQTGRMLEALDGILEERRPDWVLVYGDTNSTLAGAICAAKLKLPLAHVEAGLRSRNREMPEEINRVLTDHCADLLLCPTATAMGNLASEGLAARARWVGDPMLEALEAALATGLPPVHPGAFGGESGYVLVTLHRPANVDQPAILESVMAALAGLPQPCIFPVHPRTAPALAACAPLPGNVRTVAPVSYLEMLALERGARVVLTDSGGVQREAFFLGVPTVVLRGETEWPETLVDGGALLSSHAAPALKEALLRQLSGPRGRCVHPEFRPGVPSQLVVDALEAA